MKEQSQITLHTRRNVYRPKVENTKNAEHIKSSFRPAEEIIKPNKIQKPSIEKPTRKSTRLTGNKQTQPTLLELYAEPRGHGKNTKSSHRKVESSKSETLSKRKLETVQPDSNKKQKTVKSSKKTTEVTTNEVVIEQTTETIATDDETKIDDTVQVDDKLKKPIEMTPVVYEKTVEKVEKKANHNHVVEKVQKNANDETTNAIQKECNTNKETQEEDTEQNDTYEFEHQIEPKSSFSTASACSLVEDDSFVLDTPSPTFHSEPMTPPHLDNLSVPAPYKTILSPADKARINDEKLVLMKLRKALDVVITDRIAHNQPVLYHKVESVLRNSTRRTIVIGHLCQIMSVAPELYDLHAKEIRDFGGKATEAYLIEFGKDWIVPLVGKDLQKRSDMLEHGIDHYFESHKEPYATIPKKELPKLKQVVDKKDWLNDAKLPPGVKSLITAHEKVKAIEAEKAKPKPKPQGSVKDRLAALKARLKEKKA